MKKILLLLTCVIAYGSSIAQCMKPVDLNSRTANADLIIEGKVTAKQSFWNAAHNMIYTSNTVEIYKVFKGTSTSTSIEIMTMGGTVGLNRITAEPSLSLKQGDIGIFTCETVKRFNLAGTNLSSLPKYEAYASSQGFIKYDLNTQTATDPFFKYNNIEADLYSRVLSPSLSSWITVAPFDIHANAAAAQRNGQPLQVQSISGFSPSTVTAGTGSTITITGTGFGATQGSGSVGFKNADDGGATYIQPLASQYISWSNTQIVVEVPSGAGTGNIQVTQGATQTSGSVLTVSYANLNVEFDPGPGTIAYPTDHIDDNGSGGYTWRMNTGFDGNALAKASFMRAFDTWRCNTGINWTIGATTSINDAVSDGTNCICFDNTASLSSGILGVCYSYWSGCASGPTIVWYVNELDIIFDEGSNISPLTWQYGPSAPSINQYDFESVAVHELGHGHQLGHVINNGAIMHYALSNGSFNHTPGTTDLAGAGHVQTNSEITNVCGPGAMSHYSCGTPPVASFSANVTTVCDGGTVSFTDMSTNIPTSWAWTFTGGSPSSSTAQNPTVTYNTPGTYPVTLVATNATGSNTLTMSGYITVNANVTPAVSISLISGSNPMCTGASASFSATVSNGGTTPSFQWKVNGSNAGTNSAVFTTSSLTNGQAVTCILTSNASCATTSTASSSAITMTVNGSVTPAVSIALTSGSNPGCNGSSFTFSASPVNGGSSPDYQWLVNGGNAGTNSAIFSSSSLSNGDAVTCILTSNSSCASTPTAVSSAITLTLNSSVTPMVTIAQTAGTNSMCLGSSASFSASAVNGGSTPAYQWKVNGSNAGTNSSVFTTSSLTNGQAVTCILTSNASCATTSTASSSAITMTVNSCSTGTAVTTVPCGLTISNLSQAASAANVTGATQYRLRFYNSVTNALVATKTQASRTFTFNTISGIYYNNTYKWTVAVDKGSGFGPESNSSCTIIFAEPKTTVPCGVSYSNLNAYTTTGTFISGAKNYRFSFYNNTTNALVAVKTQTSNYIYFNQVPGLAYGNTYKWTVEVEYNNGTANVFAPASSSVCTITFNAPQTTVPCGVTYAKAGYTTVTPVTGGNAYRYNFYDVTTNSLVATVTNTNTYVYFNQVPGLTFNKAYKWTVAVRYNNGTSHVFGPESSNSCTMNYGTPSSMIINDDSNAARLSVQSTESNNELYVNVFPNPAKDQITIEASEPVTDLKVYNVSGELVLAPENFTAVDLHDLKAGLYVLSIKTEKELKHIRIIKE
jgi:PKD repeat protein